MLSVDLPVSPTTPQGSLGVHWGDTVMPLLPCVPTVAGDSDNESVTHPAPGPGFSQHLLSQGGNGETWFQVKTNINTIQSKSPFNTSPNTGVRLRIALFSSGPSGCHQQHKGITERKMRRCHQNRLYLHSHEVQRDQTPVTEQQGGSVTAPSSSTPTPRPISCSTGSPWHAPALSHRCHHKRGR